MIGIREAVKKLVEAWWASASAEERYTKRCKITPERVLREIGINAPFDYQSRKQASDLIVAHVHFLQENSFK